MRDPRFVAEMLRRAAEASRNARKQMVGETDWFSWVPQYLDREAEHLEVDAGGTTEQDTP